VADRLAATGILLVGGASERFGSPKALARLRGETLAERAWHVLGEACDEVIAVGKERDELELPFPVLDDGSGERAPIFGVIAGSVAAWLIVTRLMTLSFVWQAGSAAGVVAAALIVTVGLGLAGTLLALNQKPATVLRNL